MQTAPLHRYISIDYHAVVFNSKEFTLAMQSLNGRRFVFARSPIEVDVRVSATYWETKNSQNGKNISRNCFYRETCPCVHAHGRSGDMLMMWFLCCVVARW